MTVGINKTIAIDDEDIVTLFTEVLQDNGYYVKGFTNTVVALDFIQEHPDEFSLIIVDYRMSPCKDVNYQVKYLK